MVALYLPNSMGLFWNFFEQISGRNAGLQSELKKSGTNIFYCIIFPLLVYFAMFTSTRRTCLIPRIYVDLT